MICVMSILNGREVRRRARELAPVDTSAHLRGKREASPHIAWLAETAGIPVGTVQNSTRPRNPQVISPDKVKVIARVLQRDDETLRDVLAAITVEAPSVMKQAS